jgi:hypothetical protein
LLGGGDSAAPNARPATSTERVREYRKRKKEEGAKPEPISEAEVQNAASMAATIWDIAVVPLAGGRLRRLDNEQAERLGRVTAPLVRKYLPLLGNWQEEVLAVFVGAEVLRLHKEYCLNKLPAEQKNTITAKYWLGAYASGTCGFAQVKARELCGPAGVCELK